MSVYWYTLYAFVVGRETGDQPRYWFSSYIVLPQPSDRRRAKQENAGE